MEISFMDIVNVKGCMQNIEQAFYFFFLLEHPECSLTNAFSLGKQVSEKILE